MFTALLLDGSWQSDRLALLKSGSDSLSSAHPPHRTAHVTPDFNATAHPPTSICLSHPTLASVTQHEAARARTGNWPPVANRGVPLPIGSPFIGRFPVSGPSCEVVRQGPVVAGCWLG